MTSSDTKQDFINRTLVLLGRMTQIKNEQDEVFLMGLIEIEHAVKSTRGALAVRRIIDTEGVDDDEL